MTRKRRFIATIPLVRALSHRSTSHDHDEQEQHEEHDASDEVPMGVTPPSPVCLSDSVLLLFCPRCEINFYISRGMLSSLTECQEVMEALAPGLISWFNPDCASCHTRLQRIKLNENMHDDSTT